MNVTRGNKKQAEILKASRKMYLHISLSLLSVILDRNVKICISLKPRQLFSWNMMPLEAAGESPTLWVSDCDFILTTGKKGKYFAPWQCRWQI